MKSPDRSLLFITIGAILLHGAVFFWLSLERQLQMASKPLERLIVKTVDLQPPPSIALNEPPKNKVQQKPSPPPKPKPVSKKTAAPEKKNEKIAMAKENVAKLLQTRDKFKAIRASSEELKDLSAVPKLRIDSSEVLNAEENGYHTLLGGKLREVLRLSDEGDVKIRLTLDRKGKVIKMETLHAANEHNRKYVETMLPKIQFPAFGICFKGEETHSFVITLTNDI